MIATPVTHYAASGFAGAALKTGHEVLESEDMENSIGVRKSRGRTLESRIRTMARPATVLLMAAVAALSGCSSSSSPKPQVVSIAVTDEEGNVLTTPLTSLTVNTGVYMDVTLANDSSGLGADWTVQCGSAPAPGTPLPPGQTINTECGTFTPVHTLSAPVPNYVTEGAGYVTLYTAPSVPPQAGIVTLYAAATADPSRYASLAFPIVGLPISVGFAPQPPASLAVNGAIALKAVVSNDYTPKGVTWSVVCGSSACGAFSPVQTASGAATTYTAPSTVPTAGTVTISATSVTDPTKAVSATITIAPVAVSVAPATLSVAVGGTGLLNATVINDVSNAGVDWSLSCASQSACGSITAHTASGGASTYTAPSDVPADGTVTGTATSTADKTVSASAVITVTSTATPSVSGIVRGGLVPIAGASISLYAAGETGYGSASTLLNDKTKVTTDGKGRFTVMSTQPCSSAGSLLYVVAQGGNARGGTNPNVALLTALGPCNRVASSAAIVIDEATTVAAAYALLAFMRDAAHVGVAGSNHAGLASAFATANAIADNATGDVRSITPEGATVPRTEIDTLANMLHRCVASAGDGTGDGAGDGAGDGTMCDRLFSRTSTPIQGDTIQAALSLARGAARGLTSSIGAGQLFELAGEDGPYEPTLNSAPPDWMLRLTYPDLVDAGQFSQIVEQTGFSAAPDAALADGAGNAWQRNRDGTVTETVGAMPPRVP